METFTIELPCLVEIDGINFLRNCEVGEIVKWRNKPVEVLERTGPFLRYKNKRDTYQCWKCKVTIANYKEVEV